ncbi:MAG: hypothetical protein KDA57_03615 [Planctomycetales bacterium]|nr:hypothetical protein [Planctomycetales bacterium]
MQSNLLQISLPDFKHVMKPFTAKRRKLCRVLLTYERGLLTIESGEASTIMRAEGEWHGRAYFSPEVLRAIALYPPATDPVVISYAEGHVMLATMTISCEWVNPADELARAILDPDILDLLALGRTMPRAEGIGTGLGRKISSAQQKAVRCIASAKKDLSKLGVTQQKAITLAGGKVSTRMT